SADIKARLSSNENSFGPSDKAKKAIMEAIEKSYQYPNKYLAELIEKIAAYEQLSSESVMLGAGSGPLLQAAAIYFARNGGTIVSGDPTYRNISNDIESHFKATWKRIPLTADYKLDLDAKE